MMKSNIDADGFRIAIKVFLDTDPTHKVEVHPFNETALRAQTGIWGDRDRQDAHFALQQGAVTIGVTLNAWGDCHRTEATVKNLIEEAEQIAKDHGGIRVEGSGRVNDLTDLCGFIPQGSKATPRWRFPRSRIYNS